MERLEAVWPTYPISTLLHSFQLTGLFAGMVAALGEFDCFTFRSSRCVAAPVPIRFPFVAAQKALDYGRGATEASLTMAILPRRGQNACGRR